ncbi:MAG: bifunctional diaminohydroxyphosphoribosylaminopyrimidine deaminase/5-amino-6-(5-phosphoribosylamino)uracil reductase RibD [Methanocella sp.]
MIANHDKKHMARALALAARGLYTTMPNPRVGCVLVKDGVVIGEGWHQRAGEPHAEVHALAAAGAAAEGATAYVTLEPCSHHGRTPPCANALVAARVKRVVCAMQDPNPLVAGRGIAALQAAGIETKSGVLEDEARELNIGFVSRMMRGRPWVRMKIAASLDGRTALANGRSQWITGEAARRDGHKWRARACAILTGIGTVREDDPQLTVRGVRTTRQPVRIVVDGRLETPPAARVVAPGTLIVTAIDDRARAAVLRERGAEILPLPNAQSKVDLRALLDELGRRAVNEVHVEAGRGLNGAMLNAGLVDELLVYMAPMVLGDAARGMFALPVLEELEGARRFRLHEVKRMGADVRLIARAEV